MGILPSELNRRRSKRHGAAVVTHGQHCVAKVSISTLPDKDQDCSAQVRSDMITVQAHLRADFIAQGDILTLDALHPVELTCSRNGPGTPDAAVTKKRTHSWNAKIPVATTTVSYPCPSPASKSPKPVLTAAQMKSIPPSSRPMSEVEIGDIPKDWFKPLSETIAFWGSASLALLMEAAHDDPAREAWHNLYGVHTPLEHRFQYVRSWGMPDVFAARMMCRIGCVDLAEVIGYTHDALHAIELGWLPLDIDSVLEMTTLLNWPLAVLFRNVDLEWHPRTQLSKRFNLWGRGL
jgi:hypothetical protein